MTYTNFLIKRAFGHARFKDQMFAPVLSYNYTGKGSDKDNYSMVNQVSKALNLPNYAKNLASYSNPISNYTSTTPTAASTTPTTTAASTATANLSNFTPNQSYLTGIKTLQNSDYWNKMSETAQQYVLDKAQSIAYATSPDGINMVNTGATVDMDKILNEAKNLDALTNGSTLNWGDQTGYLGLKNSTWQGIGAGLNLANFGLNGILGYMNYRNAKKAMEQQNAYNHATYAANAKAYNTKLRSGNYIGRALAGSNYTDEMRAADDAALNKAYVAEDY